MLLHLSIASSAMLALLALCLCISCIICVLSFFVCFRNKLQCRQKHLLSCLCLSCSCRMCKDQGWMVNQCPPIPVIIIIITIALKGAIQDFFYNLLTPPRTVSNMYAPVAREQSCTNHTRYIECLLPATCRVTCHVIRRDSPAIKFDRV